MDMKDYAQFPCDMCGMCCRHINRTDMLKEYDTGNGICKYLKDNKCSIYANRPDICNVDLMYEKFFKKYMSKEEYYNINIEVCNQLKNG